MGRAPSRIATSASSRDCAITNEELTTLSPGSCAQTRSGVIGSARTRAPVALAIALPIAAAVGTQGGSPTPFDPHGPALDVGVSIQSVSMEGASNAVTSL